MWQWTRAADHISDISDMLRHKKGDRDRSKPGHGDRSVGKQQNLWGEAHCQGTYVEGDTQHPSMHKGLKKIYSAKMCCFSGSFESWLLYKPQQLVMAEI